MTQTLCLLQCWYRLVHSSCASGQDLRGMSYLCSPSMAQHICLLPMSSGVDMCLQSHSAWDPGWILGCSWALVYMGSLNLQILVHNIVTSGGLGHTIAQIAAFILRGQRPVLQLYLVLVSLQRWCATMNPVPWFTAAEPGTQVLQQDAEETV